MINNGEQILEYENYNKIYIPTEYYNENYQYTISNDEITIYTNLNCYTSYNSRYCDCYRYNERYNIVTNSYSCRVDNISNYIISNESITDDINYSDRITRDYVNNYSIMYGIVIIALLVTILFKRNSRNI